MGFILFPQFGHSNGVSAIAGLKHMLNPLFSQSIHFAVKEAADTLLSHWII